jgi:hypothetical protein
VVVGGDEPVVYTGNVEEGLEWMSGMRFYSVFVIELTCHFKQLGLNDGRPAAASWSVLKIYRHGTLEALGDLCGSGFGGRVTRGTRSKSFFTGAGIEKRSLMRLDPFWPEEDEESSAGPSCVCLGGMRRSARGGGMLRLSKLIMILDRWPHSRCRREMPEARVSVGRVEEPGPLDAIEGKERKGLENRMNQKEM